MLTLLVGLDWKTVLCRLLIRASCSFLVRENSRPLLAKWSHCSTFLRTPQVSEKVFGGTFTAIFIFRRIIHFEKLTAVKIRLLERTFRETVSERVALSPCWSKRRLDLRIAEIVIFTNNVLVNGVSDRTEKRLFPRVVGKRPVGVSPIKWRFFVQWFLELLIRGEITRTESRPRLKRVFMLRCHHHRLFVWLELLRTLSRTHFHAALTW